MEDCVFTVFAVHPLKLENLEFDSRANIIAHKNLAEVTTSQMACFPIFSYK